MLTCFKTLPPACSLNNLFVPVLRNTASGLTAAHRSESGWMQAAGEPLLLCRTSRGETLALLTPMGMLPKG